MFYAIVIIFGALLIFVWRFTSTKKQMLTKLQDDNQYDRANDREIEANAVSDVKQNINNNWEVLETVINKYAEERSTKKYETQTDSPSKQSKEDTDDNIRFRKSIKRDSPPKERLAEFLEKTVLNEDKLQSIFENLSLTKCDIPIINKDVTEVSNKDDFEIKAVHKVDNAVTKEEVPISEEQKEETKPLLLRRLEKQSGIPAGINFGSLIGELKTKTRKAGNGGALKPVFRKFDVDTVDNIQDETLNSAVDDKKKVHIDENELGSNILADRRNKLETAAQGWRKRVPQSDATMFTVAGRLERDKVTPPVTPPPLNTPPATTPSTPVVTPAVPPPNRFRSRKAPTSPTNGFASGPLRSASCAVMSAVVDAKPKETPKPDRESFKRSHSVSENISRDEKEELSPGAEKPGCPVHVPRADDETFHAFFAPLQQQEKQFEQLDIDLDAIDSASRQLLSSEYARRAKRERRHVASRNPLKALAARTDLRQEYRALSLTTRDALFKEKVTGNCGLAAEALAALASKEDFSNVALRSASATNVPNQGTKALMLLHVKGRRRVQTRLVEPVHTNVNRGDCFLLVTSDQLFLYIGLYANVIEKNRSTDIANHILNTKDLGCKSANSFIKIDEQTKVFSNKHWSQFWSLLGVTAGIEEYKPVEAGDPDEDEIFESCIVQTNMCYEVMDDELVPIKEYWGQVPKIAMLNQSKVLVFDFGSEMYIWYGKNVPLESRRQAAQLAKELYEDGYNYEECHINPLNA
ncbi:unnamed protein product, partial [Pieris brassicae]